MAHQADLYNIGVDGFAIIEEHFAKKHVAKPYASQKFRAPRNHAPIKQRNIAAKGPQPIHHCIYQLQESHIYVATRVSFSEATVITSHETELLHDGTVSMDFPRRRSTRMAF